MNYKQLYTNNTYSDNREIYYWEKDELRFIECNTPRAPRFSFIDPNSIEQK